MPRYTQLGVWRLGAARLGYHSAHAFLSIGGVQVAVGYSATGRTLFDSLTVIDLLNEQPNTMQWTAYKARPTVGQEVILQLGSMNNGRRFFAGHILGVQQFYVGQKPVALNIEYAVAAVDYTWQLGFKKVTAFYPEQSATLTAQSLAALAAVNGFTAVNIQVGLPTVPGGITFTDEDLPDALTRLAARIGGYWYVDYLKDLHFFLTDTGQNPTDLTASHPSLADVVSDVDLSQHINRAYVEGRGSSVLAPVQAGDTTIPLESVDMFTVTPNVFLKCSFQGAEGGAQHLTFTGVEPGGGGALVGPGVSPAAGPAPAMVVGAGLSVGTYYYQYTDVTAAGESLPSPPSGVVVGSMTAPASAPSRALDASETGPDLGSHYYAFTFYTAGGETTPSPISATVTTDLATLTAYPYIASTAQYGGGSMNDANWFGYTTTYVGANGGETAPVSITTVYLEPGYTLVRLNLSYPQPGAASMKLYRTSAQTSNGAAFSATKKLVATIGLVGAYDDTMADGSLGAAAPTVNTATYHRRKVQVYNLALGPAVGTTGRKIYRTAAGGAQLKLVATIADNTTTTYNDTIADAALGADAPVTNTAGAGLLKVDLASIATGPTGTTQRKLYRTVVNGGPFKLLATLADNSTTTYSDTTPDGSLGAVAPSSDTSALTQPDGQVLAGATSVLICGTGAFLPGGGWALIGSGDQLLRYTGYTGNTLTGVPATGVGSIKATVAYNSTITAAPMLTGIPASGAGSITRAMAAGDEIYLVVQRDNLADQGVLAALLGGDGIREEWIQDRRLSIAEAQARGDAFLASRPLDAASIRYRCRDLNTVSGKDITVNLASPTSVTGVFKIQQVTIANFRPYATQYPTFSVEAAAQRYSFEDLLRQRKAG